MASYHAFYPYEQSLIGEIFTPIQFIKERIDDRCTQFVNNTIGVHIRRTDNIASIQQSPLVLFFEIVDEELDKDNHTMIYLATDSEEVKLQMGKRYGNRIISSSTPADRNSVAGIQDGLIDMYTLARTRKIYGSFQSSFSEMASQIGGIPIEILKKKKGLHSQQSTLAASCMDESTLTRSPKYVYRGSETTYACSR